MQTDQTPIDPRRVHIRRTLQGTVIEAVAAGCLMLSFLIIFVTSHRRQQADVPAIILTAVMALTIAFLLFSAYHPDMLTWRKRQNPIRNWTQIGYYTAMVRYMALGFAVLELSYIATKAYGWPIHKHVFTILWGAVASFYPYYLNKIEKADDEE